MPLENDTDRRPEIRFLWPAGTLVFGLVMASASWLLQRNEPWWSGILANGSVALLLLTPGEWILSRVRTSFERVEGVAEQARETAESAKRAAEQTAQSLEEVRRNLLSRQIAEHESELDIYRSFTESLSRDSLIRGLWHATTTGVVTSAGVRSPVWETNLHYRYIVSNPTTLEVNLETDEGRILSSHRWEDGTPAEEFLQSLVLAVRAAGYDLGVKLNDPTESIEALSEMLIEVTQLRSQELLGYRSTLRKIIERVDGWYFTEDHVLPEDNLRYEIQIDRLNEIDWEKHLYNKGWHGAPTALAFARRLYRIDKGR